MLTYHWSRAPGKFINKLSGEEVLFAAPTSTGKNGPTFFGTVRDWYDTLPPTLNDLAQEAGGADSLFVGYDVLSILEHTREYNPYEKSVYPGVDAVLYGKLGECGFKVCLDKNLTGTVELRKDDKPVAKLTVLDTQVI